MEQQALSPAPKLGSTFQLMQQSDQRLLQPHCERHQQTKRRQEDEKKILKLSVKNCGISPLAEAAFSYPCLLEAELRPAAGLTRLSGSLPNMTGSAIVPLSLSSPRELCVTVAPHRV